MRRDQSNAPDVETKAGFRSLGGAARSAAHTGSGIVDSLGRRWNSNLHPRDARGRFIETGGIARVGVSGRTGKVIRALGGNPARVLMEFTGRDGKRTRKSEFAAQITMIRRPDGSKPVNSKDRDAMERVLDEDARRDKDPRRGAGDANEDDLGDRDQDGVPDAVDAAPDDPSDRRRRVQQGPAKRVTQEGGLQRFTTLAQVQEHWEAGADGGGDTAAKHVGKWHRTKHGWSPQLSEGGSFVVARKYEGTGAAPGTGWEVRHSGSGWQFGTARTKRDALALAQALEETDVDWDDPGLRNRPDLDPDSRVMREVKDRTLEIAKEKKAEADARKARPKGSGRGPGGVPAGPEGVVPRAPKRPMPRPLTPEMQDRFAALRDARERDPEVAAAISEALDRWWREDDAGATRELDRAEALAGRDRQASTPESGQEEGGPGRDRGEPKTAEDILSAAGQQVSTESRRAIDYFRSNLVTADTLPEPTRTGVRAAIAGRMRDRASEMEANADRAHGYPGLGEYENDMRVTADWLRRAADEIPEVQYGENRETAGGQPEHPASDEPVTVREGSRRPGYAIPKPPEEGEPGEQQPVRGDRPEVLGDVPAEQGRGDTAGRQGGVLPEPGQAGGQGGRGSDAEPGRGGPGRGGVPGEGRPVEQREDAGRGAGPGGSGVPGSGAGDRGSGASAGAARQQSGGVAARAPKKAPRFRPQGQKNLTPSGQAARVKANIEALRTLRELEAGDRPATPEEQRVLAAWSGWGAVPDAVDPGKKSRYVTAAQQTEITELLGGRENVAAARQNTLNAHYTDAGIVDAIWDAVESLGVKGGLVGEPGSGSGNFIGRAPDGTQMVGVELDPITAGISKYLYPDAEIRNESFGDTRIPEGTFDAVVGNVPFGNYPVTDPRYNKKLQHNIHNHFIIKSLALTRPGGVVALVTSRYTMDAEDSRARQEMAKYGDLVTAVRLPSGAHEKAAGTGVVTDVLVFRRRADDEPPGDTSWVQSTKTDVNGWQIPVNRWFQEHPEDVLGTLSTERGQFSDHDLAVVGDKDAGPALKQRLQEVAREATESGKGVTGVQDTRPLSERVSELLDVGSDKHEGHISLKDGKFVQVDGGRETDVKVPKTQHDELRRLVELRDIAHNLLSAEAKYEDDTPRIESLRRALNDAYDGYVSAYGPINRFGWRDQKDSSTGEVTKVRKPPPQGGFRRDPASAVVFALEKYNQSTGTATKASIFTGRVVAPRKPVEHVEAPDEALAVVMDTHGEVVLPEVARLLGVDQVEARKRLGRLVFDEPGTGRLITSAEYLSGNVRKKLVEAREAAAEDERFAVNIPALEAVVPKDLTPGEIDGRLGAAWIDAGIVQQFLQGITGDTRLKVENPVGSLWTVDGGEWGVAATKTWGTDRMSAGEIAERLLTQHPVEVFDTVKIGETKKRVLNPDATDAAQAKAAEMQERFSEWLWEDPSRAEKLTRVYNDRYNSLVMRQRSAAKRAMPGLVDWFKPHPHQYQAIDGIVNEPTMLLDHVVGAGKTAEMVMGAMELRRLGLVKKPAIVIPNHMLEQFKREFLQLYPQAKLLAAGSADLAGDKRRQFVARAATGDWDAVVLTQRAFNSIPMSVRAQQNYIEDQVAALENAIDHAREAGMSSSTLKQVQKRMASRKAQIEKRLSRKKDPGLSFEQTGIDYLMVDEAHHFKNLFTPSSARGAGIDGSTRSSDLDMKLHYLRDKAGPRGRVATFATGTPIANSVAEQYVMTRYLRPDLLGELGIDDFDSWLGTFAETVTDVEVTNDGQSFNVKSRLAKFRNVPELLRVWGSFTDTKTKDDLHGIVTTPELVGGRPEMVEVEPTLDQEEVIADIQRRMATAKSGQFLKLFGDGRRAAQDLRLLDTWGGDPEDGESGRKLRAVADRVAGLYDQNRENVYLDEDTKEPHPTSGALQIVFMDQGTPGEGKDEGRWNAYEDLRDELVARGVPAEKIRFVHEAKNDKQKDDLFTACRDGRVAVLVGSTEKMGVGTNVQNRAVALHHVDIPWRPADVEQREGRLIRQGNQNPQVRVLRYVTKQSFDAYSWQTIERKARFIAQVKRGTLDVREMEDIGDAVGSFAVAKASASGNPRLMEKAKVDEDVKRLGRLARGYERSRDMLRREITQNEQGAESDRAEAERLEALIPQRVDTGGDKFSATFAGTAFTSRADAGEALAGNLAAMLEGYVPSGFGEEQEIGRVGGFRVTARTFNRRGSAPLVLVFMPELDKTELFARSKDDLRGNKGAGLVTRLENRPRAIERTVESLRARADSRDQERAKAQVEVGKPFRYAADLEAATRRQQALDQLFKAQALSEHVEDRDSRIAYVESVLERMDAAEGIDREAEAEAEAFSDSAPVKRTAADVVPSRPQPVLQPRQTPKAASEGKPVKEPKSGSSGDGSTSTGTVRVPVEQVARDLEDVGVPRPRTGPESGTPSAPEPAAPEETVSVPVEDVQRDLEEIGATPPPVPESTAGAPEASPEAPEASPEPSAPVAPVEPEAAAEAPEAAPAVPEEAAEEPAGTVEVTPERVRADLEEVGVAPPETGPAGQVPEGAAETEPAAPDAPVEAAPEGEETIKVPQGAGEGHLGQRAMDQVAAQFDLDTPEGRAAAARAAANTIRAGVHEQYEHPENTGQAERRVELAKYVLSRLGRSELARDVDSLAQHEVRLQRIKDQPRTNTFSSRMAGDGEEVRTRSLIDYLRKKIREEGDRKDAPPMPAPEDEFLARNAVRRWEAIREEHPDSVADRRAAAEEFIASNEELAARMEGEGRIDLSSRMRDAIAVLRRLVDADRPAEEPVGEEPREPSRALDARKVTVDIDPDDEDTAHITADGPGGWTGIAQRGPGGWEVRTEAGGELLGVAEDRFAAVQVLAEHHGDTAELDMSLRKLAANWKDVDLVARKRAPGRDGQEKRKRKPAGAAPEAKPEAKPEPEVESPEDGPVERPVGEPVTPEEIESTARAAEDAPPPSGPQPGGIEAAPDDDETDLEQDAPDDTEIPNSGDLGLGITWDVMDHGMVLGGNTYGPEVGSVKGAHKEIIKNVRDENGRKVFLYREIPGAGNTRYGKPKKAWTYQGPPEGRKKALQALAKDFGLADPFDVEEKYPPTPQQQDVIDAVLAGKDTVVRALAGTGKTSTLEMIARRMLRRDVNRRVIYVAFNASIAEEAGKRMPANVESRTGDSIAFISMPSGIQERFHRQKNPQPGDDTLRRNDEIAAHLGLGEPLPLPGGDEAALNSEEQAQAVMRAVEEFCISADDDFRDEHFPPRVRDPRTGEVPAKLRRAATAAWADLRKPDGKIRITNSHITKMWALGRPDLSNRNSGVRRPADVVFFDESQDINPVMAKVIADQNLQKVYVGDSAQAIYGFRGAVDQLDKVTAESDLPLTKSWRFGPEIAGYGNRFLDLLDYPFRVEGGGPSAVIHESGTMSLPDAVLVRSNAGAIEEIVNAQRGGRLVGVPKGGKGELISLIDTAEWLQGASGILPKVPMPDRLHDDLAPFRTWGEFSKEVEKGGDPKLKMLHRIVTDNDLGDLRAMVRDLIDLGDKEEKRTPDMVVSTAHKAKGLEWDRVKIGPDFRGPKKDPNTGVEEMPSPEELRLAYVAVTRAKKELDPGSLAWVEGYTDENGGEPGTPGHVPEAAPADRVEIPVEQVRADMEEIGASPPEVPEGPQEAPGTVEAGPGEGQLSGQERIDGGERGITAADDFLVAEEERVKPKPPPGPGEGQEGLFEAPERPAPERPSGGKVEAEDGTLFEDGVPEAEALEVPVEPEAPEVPREPEAPAEAMPSRGPVNVSPLRVAADSLRVGDVVEGKFTDGERGRLVVESAFVSGAHTVIRGRRDDTGEPEWIRTPNRYDPLMVARASDPDAERAWNRNVPVDPDRDPMAPGLMLPSELRAGDLIRHTGKVRGRTQSGTRDLRLLHDPRGDSGSHEQLDVQEEPSGTRDRVSLDARLPVRVLERGPLGQDREAPGFEPEGEPDRRGEPEVPGLEDEAAPEAPGQRDEDRGDENAPGEPGAPDGDVPGQEDDDQAEDQQDEDQVEDDDQEDEKKDEDNRRRRRRRRNRPNGAGGGGFPGGGLPGLPGLPSLPKGKSPRAGGGEEHRARPDGHEQHGRKKVAGHRPEDLDAMTWDQVSDLVGDVADDETALEELLSYIDARQDREVDAPVAGGHTGGELASMPLDDLAAVAGGGTVEDAAAALAAADRRERDAGGDSIIPEYQRTTPEGRRAKPFTVAQLREQVRELNRAELERRVARHQADGRVANIDSVEALRDVLGSIEFARLLLGRDVLAARAVNGTRRADGTRAQLGEEDALAWFGRTPAEMREAGRRLPVEGLVDVDEYVASYRAEFEGGEDAGSGGAERDIDTPGGVDGEVPGEPGTAPGAPDDTSREESAPTVEVPAADLAVSVRRDAFDVAQGTGDTETWVGIPAWAVSPGDMISAGDGVASEVLDVTPGVGRDGAPGTWVTVRTGGMAGRVHHPGGSVVRVNPVVGRAVDAGEPHAAAPGRTGVLDEQGRVIPVDAPTVVTGASKVGTLTPGQVADLAYSGDPGTSVELVTVDGRTLSGRLRESPTVPGAWVVSGGDSPGQVDEAGVVSARVVAGGASVRGMPVAPDRLRPGTRVVVGDGPIAWTGLLRFDEHGVPSVEGSDGLARPLPDGALVAPVHRVQVAPETVEGRAPGGWVQSPSGAWTASVPGSWTAAVVPLGEGDGVTWRATTSSGPSTVGHADTVEDARGQVAAWLNRAGTPTLGAAGAARGPQVPPEDVAGRGASWVPVSDLSVGDLARVTGFDSSGGSVTHAGHVIGVSPVLVDRGGRSEPMMQVTLAEQPDGQSGWRGTALVPLDSLSARASGEVGQQSASAMEVMRGRLPGQIPTDSDGHGLFPGSLVTDGQQHGIVVGASRGTVDVDWDGGGTEQRNGGSLRVTDGGIARPRGWTRSGARITSGSVVQWQDGRRSGHGVVSSVDGDTVRVSTSDGDRQVGAAQVTSVGSVDSVDPGDATVDQVRADAVGLGDVLVMVGPGGVGAVKVSGVRSSGLGPVTFDVTDLRDGGHRVLVSPSGAEVTRVSASGGPVTVDPPRPVDPPHVTGPARVEDADGPTAQPPMLTVHRQAINDLGLDTDQVSDPVVAQAAARLRAGYPLTQEQATALASAVRGAADQTVRGRERARAADYLDATAAQLAGREMVSTPVDLGDEAAALTEPSGFAAGDMIAVPVPGGGMLVGRVTETSSHLGGRVWTIDVDSEGRVNRQVVTSSTPLWRLPDVPDLEDVDPVPDRPEAPPAGADSDRYARDRARAVAETVTAQAAQAVLASGTIAEAREAAADTVTQQNLSRVVSGTGRSARAGLDTDSEDRPAVLRAGQRAAEDAADQVRDAVLRTVNEAEPHDGESPEEFRDRLARMLLGLPDGLTVRPLPPAPRAPEPAAPSAGGLLRGEPSETLRVIESVIDSLLANPRPSPAQLATLIRRVDDELARRQRAEFDGLLTSGGGQRPPGFLARGMVALRRFRDRVVAALRRALQPGQDARDAVRGLVARLRTEMPQWEETRRLREVFGSRQPGAGDPGRFGMRLVRGRWYDLTTTQQLRAGNRQVEATRGTRWVLDRTVDGGPGVRALTHLDDVDRSGAGLAEAVDGQVAAQVPEVGGDPVGSVRAAEDAARAARRTWRDLAAAGDPGAPAAQAAARVAEARARDLRGKVAAAQAQAVLAELSKARDMGPSGEDRVPVRGTPGSPEVEAMLWAQRFVPREWLAAAKDAPLTVRAGDRGGYDPVTGEVDLAASPVGIPGVSPYAAGALHELMHHLTRHVPSLWASQWAYHWRRTSTGQVGARQRLGWNRARSLVEMAPYQGHGPDDVTRPDSYPDPYIGREYPDEETFEVAPMAMEALFAGSPWLDEDLRQWLLGTLVEVR